MVGLQKADQRHPVGVCSNNPLIDAGGLDQGGGHGGDAEYTCTVKPKGFADALGVGFEKNRTVQFNSIIFGQRIQKNGWPLTEQLGRSTSGGEDEKFGRERVKVEMSLRLPVKGSSRR